MFSAVQNRFRYRQNTCFRDIVFIFFLSSSESFHIPSESMLQRHFFYFFSLQFRIVSSTVRKHDLETLFSFFSTVPKRFKYHQNACFKDIIFKIVFAVPDRFKYFQKACFRDIIFIFSLQFQIVSNTIRIYKSIKAYM